MAMDFGFWKQLVCTCIVYLTFCLIGITRGYSSFLLEQLKSPDTDIPVTNEQASWIASLSIFPNPIGSVLVGMLMDRLGRRLSLKISVVFFFIGWAVIAFSKSVWQLYTGDVIIGIAIGMALCSTVYVAEISELRYRCVLLSFFIIFFSMGVLISYALTCYLTWRISAMIFCVYSFITLLLLHCIPESPYWYLKNGKTKKAMNALERLRGANSETKKECECQDIMYNLKNTKKSVFSIKEALKNWRPFSIFVMFQFCLQGSGYTVLVTYLAMFFSSFNLPFDTKKVAIGYSLLTLASSFLSPLTVNFWNRKCVMKISASGMTISMLMLVIYKSFSYNMADFTVWMVPIGLYIYVFTSTIGAVTLSESMPSELYPTEVRGMMCGITEAFSTILTGLYVKMFPVIQTLVGTTWIVSVFTLFSFLTLLFGIFILPETHGKTLNEIQDLHFKKKSKSSKVELSVC